MRLNNGLPVWHASVSVQHKKRGLYWDPVVEETAMALLEGVGGPYEWWFFNDLAGVGHLRAPIVTVEAELVPPGIAVADAGEAGLLRPRRPLR